jgi:hypothetical protein
MGLGILGVGTAAISLLVVNVGHKDGGASQAILLRGGAGSLEITGAF